MEQWLAGVPLGALLGFALKAAYDWLRDSRQRKHDRHLRLLDTALAAAVDFLAAADRVARSAQGVSTAWITLDNVKGRQDEAAFSTPRSSLRTYSRSFGLRRLSGFHMHWRTAGKVIIPDAFR